MKKKVKKSEYITDTKSFNAKIVKEGGKNRLKIMSETWYQTQLNKLKEGEVVSIYISSKRPKRSDQQNRYYWGVYLPYIAQETGETDLERLHNLFKGKFLTKGIYKVLGEAVRVTKSTTDLSKNDFSEYIMSIEADTGIQAPLTEEWLALYPQEKGKFSTD